LVVVFVLVALVLSPLAALGMRSVTRLEADRGDRGEVQTGLTLAYYQALFVNSQGSIFYVQPLDAIRNSLLFAFAAALIALLVGGLAAYGLRHTTIWARGMEVLFLLPMGSLP
jgi:thiamine transport system permease protein